MLLQVKAQLVRPGLVEQLVLVNANIRMIHRRGNLVIQFLQQSIVVYDVILLVLLRIDQALRDVEPGFVLDQLVQGNQRRRQLFFYLIDAEDLRF